MKPKQVKKSKSRDIQELLTYLGKFTDKLLDHTPVTLTNVDMFTVDDGSGCYRLIRMGKSWVFLDRNNINTVNGCLMDKWNNDIYSLIEAMRIAKLFTREESHLLSETISEEMSKRRKKASIQGKITELSNLLDMDACTLKARIQGVQ